MLTSIPVILIIEVVTLVLTVLIARKCKNAHSYSLVLAIGIAAVISPTVDVSEGGAVLVPAIIGFLLQSSFVLYNYIPFVIVFIIVYFFAYRRFQKKQNPIGAVKNEAMKYLSNPVQLDIYCKKFGISEEEVQAKIGKGQIKAYSHDGILYVDGDVDLSRENIPK